jgi:hypothetical protein
LTFIIMLVIEFPDSNNLQNKKPRIASGFLRLSKFSLVLNDLGRL